MSTSSLLPWVVVAVCVHGAAFAASDRPAPAASGYAPPLEVELGAVDPEPPPAPTAPVPPEEDRPSEPTLTRPAKMAPRPVATSAPSVAAAAKVGALLTAGETEDSADPVAFFSDPNGGAYGSGVVARGGQAEHGAGPTVAAAVPVSSAGAGRAEDVTLAAKLSRPPTLDEPDACRGFFPTDAALDTGKVDLVVVVQPGGQVSSATIARESPPGEGFGQAARACLLSKRFTPGADKGGRAVTASAAVRVFFTR